MKGFIKNTDISAVFGHIFVRVHKMLLLAIEHIT